MIALQLEGGGGRHTLSPTGHAAVTAGNPCGRMSRSFGEGTPLDLIHLDQIESQVENAVKLDNLASDCKVFYKVGIMSTIWSNW